MENGSGVQIIVRKREGGREELGRGRKVEGIKIIVGIGEGGKKS